MHAIRRRAARAATLGRRAFREFLDDDCLQRAAAISYFGLLSLFPLAIVFVAVFGFVVDDDAARREVIGFVLENVPLREDDDGLDIEQMLITVTESGRSFGIFGVAGLLFSASAVMTAVRKGLNAAWDVETARPPLRGKLIDFLLVLGAGVVLAASIATTLAVRHAAALTGHLGEPGVLAGNLLLLAGGLIPAVLAFAVCALLFALLPARSSGLRQVWPGALLAALGFEAAKHGFSLYLENAANYGAVYGSLGTVVAFMVFVFVAANLFLLGAEVASEWPQVRDDPARARAAPAPAAGSERASER